jgi:hypothetical protein
MVKKQVAIPISPIARSLMNVPMSADGAAMLMMATVLTATGPPLLGWYAYASRIADGRAAVDVESRIRAVERKLDGVVVSIQDVKDWLQGADPSYVEDSLIHNALARNLSESFNRFWPQNLQKRQKELRP